MSQIRDVLQNRGLMKYSIFIAFTAALLYILYFTIRNFQSVLEMVSSWLGSLLSALSPLLIGLFLAYLLYPLTELIARKLHIGPLKRLSPSRLRLVSILLTYLLVLGSLVAILYAFSFLILGKFVFSGLSGLWENAAQYLSSYEEVVQSWIDQLEIAGLSDTFNDMADSVLSWLAENINTSSILSLISSAGGGIINALLGLMVSIYLLKDREFFQGLVTRWMSLAFKESTNLRLGGILYDINGVISHFIRGALLDSLIVGVLSAVGLSLLGLEFAVFIGAFAGLANIIPYFGPFLGMVPAFIVGAFSGGLDQGILAVVILFAIQQLDSNFIYPKVVGSSTGLHPLFVLLAVSISGYFFGIPGMLLAVPAAGIIQVFVLKWVRRREDGSAG